MTEPINPLDDETRDLQLCDSTRCVTVFQATSGGEEKWFFQTETDRLKYGTVFHQFGPYASRKEAWKAFTEKIQNE